ncbi:MAG: hypothetical protein Kow0027_24920 [Saprospiraceae bacterium]
MKNWKVIVLVLAAAFAGLAAGYVFFGKTQPVANHEGHNHGVAAGEEKETIWTCSMHPQIRQNEPGQCPICGMDLIPLDEANASQNPLVMQMTEDAIKLANIQTMEVGAGTGAASKTIFLTGRIEADERHVASQVSHLPGRIEQLFVTFTGESVRKGQKLATIYSPALISAQKELLEARKWADSQPQLLEAVRNKLRYWKLADATIQEVEKSGKIQETLPVYADRSGVVLKRRVAVGDYVKEGSVLFDLADLNQLWVLFDAYEEDLANIRIGDKVSYTVAAIPDKTFTGTVSFIDPVVNPQTRAASVRADVRNVGGLLKPEMFVKGTIEARPRTAQKGLMVPKTAVLWTGPRSVVYVQVPDADVPSYEYREIKLGDAVGDKYLVLEGLNAGERVVINGQFVIDAAAQLNNMNSMMNRNVKTVAEEQKVPDYRAETPAEFKKQLGEAVQAYLALEQALVGSDPAAAKKAAPQLLSALGYVKMELLKGDAHMYWMEQLKALKAHTGNIAESDDLEEQRKQFGFLSMALTNAVKAFGIQNGQLYVIHCPMAFDNQGADWLSAERKVQNPYFGDAMLTCGVVKDSL